MKTVLITGGVGYIATALRKELGHLYNITSVSRDELDLTDHGAVSSWFAHKQFDVVIHTATVGGSRLKPDGVNALDANLKMYYNLLEQSTHYSRLINIGSGAELLHKDTPYGLSKHIIRTSLLEKPEFYNLRIFAVFDENELNSRFIKTNIVNHIRGRSMIIHQNKYMDFFYMKDFCSVVSYYITALEPPKEYNCSYEHTLSLVDIAEHINTLGTDKVDISIIIPDVGHDYAAPYPRVLLPLDFVGLTAGIQKIYTILSKVI